MTKPTEKSIKKLFALSGNICAFPGCDLPMVETSGTITGEVCHIKARNTGGSRYDPQQSDKERNDYKNLVLLCRHHHKIIDDEPEIYTVDALSGMKSIHEECFGRPEKAEDAFFAKILMNSSHKIDIQKNSGNIAINSPGSIQGETITVKTTSKKVSVNAPPGTIGVDQQSSRYIEYLIQRYNKFADKESWRKTKFSYGAIRKNIETKFGIKWQFLPEEKASEVIAYLQSRISKTRQAKINSGKGYSAFSSFDEFNKKHGF